MYNEFDAGDDYSNEQEMYENDLELRGNNEAWEDAQAEQEELDMQSWEDEDDEADLYGAEFNEPGDYGYDDQY